MLEQIKIYVDRDGRFSVDVNAVLLKKISDIIVQYHLSRDTTFSKALFFLAQVDDDVTVVFTGSEN